MKLRMAVDVDVLWAVLALAAAAAGGYVVGYSKGAGAAEHVRPVQPYDFTCSVSGAACIRFGPAHGVPTNR